MVKRSRDSGTDEGPSDAHASEDVEEELTDYEKLRAAIIARNRARLQELGVADAYKSFTESVAPAKKPAVKQRKKEPKERTEPARKSSRLQGAAAADESNELGFCVTNDECPRCGKAITRGHKRHLEGCKATRKKTEEKRETAENEDEDEEVQEEKPQKRRASNAKAAKLAELELSGLVNFDDAKAEFAVLGSTGSHYTITFEKNGKGFGDGKSSCQCMDYRLRRHTCKHIRLVLKQLGVERDPESWHQAIHSQLGKLKSPSKVVPQDVDPENVGEEKPLPKKKSTAKAGKQAAGKGGRQIGGRKLPASLS